MCGIVGLSKLQKTYGSKNKAMFTDMLYADVVRGHHSTGTFKVNNGAVDWRKYAGPAWEFLNLNGVPEFMNNLGDASFICGHNRWATRGEVTNDNAHPFEIAIPGGVATDSITLVHNGTLPMWDLPGKWDVDSQAVTNAIAVLGAEETSKKLDGAYSLVWYNSQQKTLNFMRNKERPMFLAHNKEFILFGSEQGLLRWIAGRHGFELDKVEATEVHKLYTFKEWEGEPVVTTVEPYRFPSTSRSWPSSNYYSRYGLDDGEDVGENNKGFGLPTKTPNLPAVVSKFRNKDVKKTLNTLKDKHKIGTGIHFSLEDYIESDTEKFTTITGDVPDNKYLMVKGNFSGSVDDLAGTKCLLFGEVSQASILKHEDRVMLFVKDIIITNKPDPFFIIKEKTVVEQHHTKIIDGSSCTECKEKFEFGERGFLTKTEGTNIWHCLCVKCKNMKFLRDAVLDQRVAN